MGCFSHRRPHVEVRPEQKWDYITINDFKSTSCFTPFAYGYLWFMLFLSVAVYSVDTFTAIQLLVFNKWSSEVPLSQLIPFDVSKWIFSICIILSFVNLAFEHIRARKIMNRGSVAECFLDNLAVRLESIRMGKGRGWKRFLVFAELTKSKKGAEYIALFTYFSFQSWIRVILCSGPRQVVNALTLYSVYNAKLSIEGDSFENSLQSLLNKIRSLQAQEAVILSGMLFTLIIWIFSFLSLLIAALFFVFFLWHYIPRADGGLTGFCERKINKRLMQIVQVKINKAMAEEDRRRRKAELKAAKKNGGDRPVSMQATLPNVGDDKLPEMPALSRADTMTTLVDSQPGTPGSFELNAMGQKRPFPSRTTTMASSASQFSARAPLLGGAAELGSSRSASPAPTLPNVDLNNYPPVRPGTSSSNRGFPPGPGALQRMPTNGSAFSNGPAPQRMPTNGSGFGIAGYTASPATYSTDTMPAFPAPTRSPVGTPDGYRGSGPTQPGNNRPYPNGPSRPPYDDYSSGRASPAPSVKSYHSNPLSPRGMGPDGYPIRSATASPMPPRGGPQPSYPQRNMTAPMQQQQQPYHQQSGSSSSLRNPYPQQPQGGGAEYDYFNRPSTANSQRGPPQQQPRGGYGNNNNNNNNGWNQDVERGRY